MTGSIGFFRNIVLISLTAVLSALIMLSTACSGSDPDITGINYELSLVDDRELNTRYEQLTVFVRPYDADGSGDLEYLYLIHDESELFWEITKDDWDERSVNNESWIGSSGFHREDYSSLPRGRYRVQLHDAAGLRDETVFVLDHPAIDISAVDFPVLRYENDLFVLESPYQQHILWLFNDLGQSFGSRIVSGPSVKTEELFEGKEKQTTDVFRIFLSHFHKGLGLSILSGPYEYRK
jgi:hypothetical protein